MTEQELFTLLQKELHSVTVSITDNKGLPWSTVMDVMLAEEGKLYFLAAKGNFIYERLKESPFMAVSRILGKSPERMQAVTLRGNVTNIGKDRLDEIFEKNAYLQEIYPNEKSRRVLEVFCMEKGEGEYITLHGSKFQRESVSFGGAQVIRKGYRIDEKRCIGCQGCRSICPVSCIRNTFPRVIDEKRCIRCGNCFQICLRRAIEKLG